MRDAPLSLTPAHIPAVTALEAHLFERPMKKDSLTVLAAGAAFRGWVLTEGADVTAYLLMHVQGEEGEILSVGTAPAYQRRGLARLLLQNAQDQLRPEGVTQLFLEVAVDNVPACSLYERMDFVSVGRRRDYYQRATGRCDAVVMRCDLY